MFIICPQSYTPPAPRVRASRHTVCTANVVPDLYGPQTFPQWEPRDFFRFEVLHESRKPGSRARLGRIHTPHGTIDTPSFVPVGTSAALKGVTDEQAVAAGVQLMFCNTYHLMVHPAARLL